jgi:hypothetical protein
LIGRTIRTIDDLATADGFDFQMQTLTGKAAKKSENLVAMEIRRG